MNVDNIQRQTIINKEQENFSSKLPDMKREKKNPMGKAIKSPKRNKH
jgi:hypothetical protein